MSDDESLKHAVLEAALRLADNKGFSDVLLAEAAKQAGADERRLFQGGVASLLAFYSQTVDGEMVRRLDGLALKTMPVRKRIRTAVLTRLEILAPHKQAAGHAAAWLALPQNAPQAAQLVGASVDAMWRAAGDVSTDFNFYTKRGTLAAVYSTTLLRWFADRSTDRHETTTFLDGRIENVMQYEKLKKQLRGVAQTGLDRFCDLVRRKV